MQSWKWISCLSSGEKLVSSFLLKTNWCLCKICYCDRSPGAVSCSPQSCNVLEIQSNFFFFLSDQQHESNRLPVQNNGVCGRKNPGSISRPSVAWLESEQISGESEKREGVTDELSRTQMQIQLASRNRTEQQAGLFNSKGSEYKKAKLTGGKDRKRPKPMI